MPQPYESGCDLNSPNRNLAPITAELDDQGRLAVGGCVLSELAERYGTPLYVLDEASIRKACQAYRDALKRHYPGPFTGDLCFEGQQFNGSDGSCGVGGSGA